MVVQKVLLFVEWSQITCITFSVELRVLNLPSGVSFFCGPLLVEQVARKGVCDSRGFSLPLMLMGERAFLNGLCAASLPSIVIESTPLLNDSTRYKDMLIQSFRKQMMRLYQMNQTDFPYFIVK